MIRPIGTKTSVKFISHAPHLSNMEPSPSRMMLLLLILLAGIVAVTETLFVGNSTVYQDEARRLALHHAILANEPPTDGWGPPGANTTNIRVMAVYLADAISRVGGVEVLKAYKAIDASSIFLVLVALGIYLRRWFPPPICALGVLFVGSVLPLTYAHHYFHPWDRPSLLLWLLTMWAIRENRPYLALFPLVLAVATKWDAVVLPGLYFMAWRLRENLIAVSIRTALMFAAAIGTYAALRIALPGGFIEKDTIAIVSANFHDLLSLNFAHPTLLVFALPAVLTVIGFRHADHFSKASVVFGLLLFLPLVTGAVFREVRAEMMILIALLPAALAGFCRMDTQR